MKHYLIIIAFASITLSAFAERAPKLVPQSAIEKGKQEEQIALKSGEFQLDGIASYYGKDFHEKNTANGEVFNMYTFTAAHRTLPFNTILQVTNINNGKTVVVRINDRGPYLKNRVIDLSKKAAESIDMIKAGTAPVTLSILYLGKKNIRKTTNEYGAITYDIDTSVHIQVASYSQLDNARRLIKLLTSKNIDSAIEETNNIYRVVIPEVNPKEINIVVKKLESMGLTQILVKNL